MKVYVEVLVYENDPTDDFIAHRELMVGGDDGNVLNRLCDGVGRATQQLYGSAVAEAERVLYNRSKA